MNKKASLTIVSTILVASAVALGAIVLEQNNCPCTPDCQPGDAWCSCPASCEN